MLTTSSSSITFNWPNTPGVAELPKDAYCVLANRSIYALMGEQHNKDKLYYFAVAVDGTTKPFFADGPYFAKYLVVYGKKESPLTRQPFQKGAFFEVKAHALEAKLLCTFQEFKINYNGVQHFIAASDDDLESKQRIESTRAVAQRTLMQTASTPSLDTLYWMHQGADLKDSYCASWIGQHFLNTDPTKAASYFESALENEAITSELEALIIKLMSKVLLNNTDLNSKIPAFLNRFWSQVMPEDLIRLQSIVEKQEKGKLSNSFLNLPDLPLNLTGDLLMSEPPEETNAGDLLTINSSISSSVGDTDYFSEGDGI